MVSNSRNNIHKTQGPSFSPPLYRYKRETSPKVPHVLIKRGLEALTQLIKNSPEDEEAKGIQKRMLSSNLRSQQMQKRMLSPAMLQDWDISETIRAMVCPQCLLEGFVFGGIFVSCKLQMDSSGSPKLMSHFTADRPAVLRGHPALPQSERHQPRGSREQGQY